MLKFYEMFVTLSFVTQLNLQSMRKINCRLGWIYEAQQSIRNFNLCWGFTLCL